MEGGWGVEIYIKCAVSVCVSETCCEKQLAVIIQKVVEGCVVVGGGGSGGYKMLFRCMGVYGYACFINIASHVIMPILCVIII
jgi:hypothetical protein